MEQFKLSEEQIEELAKPLGTYLAQNIIDYYKDPEHEKKFQEWHFKKYGRYAPALEE
ncbi:MAG: hypothetical protein IJA45_03415 [Oscillospiraceae bacterium]|nr:hypothetical protein [Oscillospiraceae bacterium]